MSIAVAAARRKNTLDERSISHRYTAIPDNTVEVIYQFRSFVAYDTSILEKSLAISDCVRPQSQSC